MSIKEYFKEVVGPIMIVLIISFVVTYPLHLFLVNGFIRLCVVTFIAIFSVGLATYFFAFNAKERILLNQLLRSAFSKLRIKRKT